MSDQLLVNGMYPPGYFALPGVDQVKSPDQLWWSSKIRFASVDGQGGYKASDKGGQPTSEFYEIDLGRVRQLNYINFSVIRFPIDITIQYDSVSSDDGTHTWVDVTPHPHMPFDDTVHFSANNKSAWFNSEFYFSDANGNFVNTRFFRIRFARRDEVWPTKKSSAFRWPILMRNLRTARYISDTPDTSGELFNTGASTIQLALTDDGSGTTSREVRQRFCMPHDAARVNIDPRLVGVSFLVNVSPSVQEQTFTSLVQMQWSVYDVTDAAPVLLRNGVTKGAPNDRSCWIDAYWVDRGLIATDRDNPRIYELRIRSLNESAVNSVYVTGSAGGTNAVPGVLLPGTAFLQNGQILVQTSQDLTGLVSPGDYIRKTSGTDGIWKVAGVAASQLTLTAGFLGVTDQTAEIEKVQPISTWNDLLQSYVPDYGQALCMRLWGDVGDQGRDILGNPYRHASHHDDPSQVLNVATEVGWTSAPQPSANAVEALYMDVRSRDSNNAFQLTLVDAIKIAPRTPGLRMHVYYTETNLNGNRPTTTAEWDNLMWNPVHVTYNLRAAQTFLLPQPIKAAFVKLEFSRLQPQPFKAATRPAHPAKKYRRYPTWIEDQFENTSIRRTIEDWFIKNKTPVEVKVLKHISDPIREFQYKEREFLAALALGRFGNNSIAAKSGFVDIKTRTLIDPTTASKIRFQTNDMYKGTLTALVDTTSVLGQVLLGQEDPNSNTDPVETSINFNAARGIPEVSSSNDRISESFAHLAATPMWFNRRCRHQYQIEQGQFNKKAYYAGINYVILYQRDYTVARDDDLVALDFTDQDTDIDSSGNLIDSLSIEQNTYLPEIPSRLAFAMNPDASGHAQTPVTVYVTYDAGGQTYSDEVITLNSTDPSSPGGYMPLLHTGVASNISVRTAPNGQGDLYILGSDYDMGYSTDFITGETVNNLYVAANSNRWIASKKSARIDRGLVQLRNLVSALEVFVHTGPSTGDVSQVLLKLIPSGADSFNALDATTFIMDTPVILADEGGVQTITGSVTWKGIPSAVETFLSGTGTNYSDTGTTTMQIIPSAVDTAQFVDQNTVTSKGSAPDVDTAQFLDGGGGVSTPVGTTGIAVRQGGPGADTLDTRPLFASFPDADVLSLWVRWSTLQPTSSTFVWPSSLDTSIDHAAANNYKIILRIGAGADAPSWMLTDATHPVTSLTTIATNASAPSQITWPVPWDTNLQFWYQALMNNVQTQFHPTAASGLTAGGTRRSSVIYFMPVSMPAEGFTYMEQNYGVGATYSTNLATLGATLTGSGTTITLASGSDTTNWPTGQHLVQIDSELIMAQSRSGLTITVATGGRAWSGSSAAGHSIGATVRFANDTTTFGSAAAPATFNSKTGIFDIAVQNQTQWAGLGLSLATMQNKLGNAWINAGGIVSNTLTGIPGSIGLGALFGDFFAQSHNVVDQAITPVRTRMYAMAVNLQPGNDGLGNPTKVDDTSTVQPSYFGGFDPNAQNAITYADNGNVIGFEVAPIAAWNQFTNPFSGSSSAFRVTVEDTLSIWGPEFIEVDSQILNSGP